MTEPLATLAQATMQALQHAVLQPGGCGAPGDAAAQHVGEWCPLAAIRGVGCCCLCRPAAEGCFGNHPDPCPPLWLLRSEQEQASKMPLQLLPLSAIHRSCLRSMLHKCEVFIVHLLQHWCALISSCWVGIATCSEQLPLQRQHPRCCQCTLTYSRWRRSAHLCSVIFDSHSTPDDASVSSPTGCCLGQAGQPSSAAPAPQMLLVLLLHSMAHQPSSTAVPSLSQPPWLAACACLLQQPAQHAKVSQALCPLKPQHLTCCLFRLTFSSTRNTACQPRSAAQSESHNTPNAACETWPLAAQHCQVSRPLLLRLIQPH